MPHPARLFVFAAAFTAIRVFAADPASAPLPRDWIDSATGHRIIRLSPDEGGSSLYFHQRSYTPEGDKIIIHTRGSGDASAGGRGGGALAAVDISTIGKSQPKIDIVAPGTRAFATAWRTREAYAFKGDAIVALHLDTKAERTVIKLPPQARGRQVAINCDETLLVGIGPDPDGKTTPRLPPSGKLIENPPPGSLEPQWAAGTPKMIYTVNLKSGEFKVLHRENDWTNHLQVSPTDPLQILFCHEGPWHYNERTWVIRADGSPAKSVHERTMNMEIWGHEFFSQDGRKVWYDLQTPMSGVFWLASYDLQTGARVWYNVEREHWSVHYNVSPDGTLFSGDGGGPTSVAARTMDRQDIKGNGQWMYAFRPVMTAGSSFRDRKPLTDVGYLKAERLADMRKHDYSKTTGVEPNGTFTPDGKWLIFSGNFHSPRDANGRAITHTYAVQIARADGRKDQTAQ